MLMIFKGIFFNYEREKRLFLKSNSINLMTFDYSS